MTLERLKELAKAGKRREGENLGEFCDRWHDENGEVRDIALPALLEVAEAAKAYADNPYTWNLEQVKAALAKLEAPDEH